MVLPWIFYIEELDDEDMGDLEYIESKVLVGDYFQVSGDIDALSDTISYTPATGKTAFLIEAKIIITDHPAPSAASSTVGFTQLDIVSAALKINSITVDETTIGEATRSIVSDTNQHGGGSGSGYGNMGDGKFNVKGLSLVGDGITSIEIENILDDGSAFATMSGYLVDT